MLLGCGPWSGAWVSLGLDRQRAEQQHPPACVCCEWGCRCGDGGGRMWGSCVPPTPIPQQAMVVFAGCLGKNRHFIVIFRHHHRKVNIDCLTIWQPLLTGHSGWPWSLSTEFSHSCNSWTSLLNIWHCFRCTFPCPCPFHYADILWLILIFYNRWIVGLFQFSSLNN